MDVQNTEIRPKIQTVQKIYHDLGMGLPVRHRRGHESGVQIEMHVMIIQIGFSHPYGCKVDMSLKIEDSRCAEIRHILDLEVKLSEQRILSDQKGTKLIH